jgi:hypothetical protein
METHIRDACASPHPHRLTVLILLRVPFVRKPGSFGGTGGRSKSSTVEN